MTKDPILAEVEAVALEDAERDVNIALAKSGKRRYFVQKPCVQLHGTFVASTMFDADRGSHHPGSDGASQKGASPAPLPPLACVTRTFLVLARVAVRRGGKTPPRTLRRV